jgi:hypothetical protein
MWIFKSVAGGSSFHVDAPPPTAAPSDGSEPDATPVPRAPKAVPAVQRAAGGAAATTTKVDASLMRAFIRDASFDTRCKRPEIAVDLEQCVPPTFALRDTRAGLTLMGPTSKGETTDGMVVRPMQKVVAALADAAHERYQRDGNGTLRHHPIFDAFAARTYAGKFVAGRVIEFNGCHAKYEYDCAKEQKAAGNFRAFHQVRAAMCAEYDAKAERGDAAQVGMFPLVDEEYFEYIMALTTAWQAARAGRPYVFIELGARYGTWIARAGAAYRLFAPAAAAKTQLKLLAIEATCEWFRKMEEHIKCNYLEAQSELILGYAAPRSYNNVKIGKPATYGEARSISLIDIAMAYEYIDMMDFDIQGFEAQTTEEPGAMDILSQRVGFIHFGTHGTKIEAALLARFRAAGWVVAYYFAGSHHKKLTASHRCATPFGPSGFNDGALGFANLKFYPQLAKHRDVRLSGRKAACHWIPEVLGIMQQKYPAAAAAEPEDE